MKTTLDGLPLRLLAREEHKEDLHRGHPFLLVNTQDVDPSASSFAITDKVSLALFNPKITMDFCNEHTVAIPVEKRHRNLESMVLVGRDSKCDIVLSHCHISRRHAGFILTHDGWYVIDLNTSNGTYMNGKKIEGGLPVKVESQSVISFGPTFQVAFVSETELSLLVCTMDNDSPM